MTDSQKLGALQQLIEANEAAVSAAAIEIIGLLDRPGVTLRSVEMVQLDDLLSKDPPLLIFEMMLPGMLDVRKSAPWSPRFEREQLFPRRIRMKHPDEEALRASLNLLNALQLLDIVFGKDYVSAVLWELVSARYSRIDVVARTLSRITHYSPHFSDSSVECQRQIAAHIDGYQNSLMLELGYDAESAYRIVVVALVYVLDRRHMLTVRSIMFPPSGSFSR